MTASGSSTGYDLVIVEFLLMAVACFFLLRYYAASMVTMDVMLTVYVSWILGFMGVLLLPYDLSIAIVYDERSAALVEVWTFVYWRLYPSTAHHLSAVKSLSKRNGHSRCLVYLCK